MSQENLPIFSILTESYRVLFANYKLYLRLVWFPALVIFAFNALISAFVWASESLWFFVLLGIYGGCLIPVATSWHRFVIQSSISENPRIGFAFQIEEFRYALATVMFLSAYLILVFAIMMVAELAGLMEAVGWDWLIVGVAVVAMWPMSCFLMVIPRVAIGLPVKVFDSIKLVKRQTFKLSLLYLASFLPVVILNELFDVLSGWNPATVEGSLVIIRSLSFTVLEVLFLTISFSVLSLSYLWLIDRQRKNPTHI